MFKKEQIKEYIINNLDKKSTEIADIFNTSHSYVSQIKRSIGIKQSNRICNLSWMIEESLQNFYWIGFILADGCISIKNELVVILNDKDEEHIKELSKLCHKNYKKYKSYGNFGESNICKIVCNHKEIIDQVKYKFDINSQKTYNPPNINKYKNFTDDQLLAILIGFIDGDGGITINYKMNRVSCKIENHASWVYFQNFFYKILNQKLNREEFLAKINSRGYSYINLSTPYLQYLNNFIIENKLYVMKRKWDKVSLFFENYINKSRQ